MSLVKAMLEATPLPSTDDPETLISDFAAMHARREALLAESPRSPLTDEDRVLVATLLDRDGVWYQALVAARDRVRDQRIAAGKLKSYL